ncbi:MAG: glycosyltransferase [Geobacteraceae bacterium]|nr:glycosyltransferase [Geobacteraceae bacterium]
METRQAASEKVELFRRFTAIVAVVVTLYYLYWRGTETLNPDALFFSWALYGAELFGAVTTFLFYFMAWKPRIRTTPPPPLEGRSVDVLIPTKSEPVHVLRKTLLACRDLSYPHRTLVLDDGERQEVRRLCEELDCVYLARTEHAGAKAGNLNFGLKHSKAEFIAVFDADHVPLPNFIERLIGYFRDEKVAFVQAPQEFYNTDSFQHRQDNRRKYIWGEQYLFFSLLQPGKDHWNSAYFVGSCALLRRKPLDEVGGFATGTITEDMLTSIRIHAKGWVSVYHKENLAYGIAAETILPFHIQRQRWGVGNWQIFFTANPFLLRGLTFPQRLNYLASMIYPLEGFQKIVFYITPPIALFTGVLPMRAMDMNYLYHFVPYFMLTLFGFNEMARGYGGQIMLEQFSMGKYFTYIKSVLLFLFPKLRSEFKVTPKGDNRLAPYSFIVPQLIVLLGSFLAVMYAVVELLLARRHDNFIVAVNCFWAIYNSGLAIAIIQYDYKKLFQRRTHFRIPDAVPCHYSIIPLAGEDPKRLLAVANNLTEDGASVVIIGQVPIGREINVGLMFPTKTVVVRGEVVQEKSIAVKGVPVSDLGIRFVNEDRESRDYITRYLHEFAISKFMNEYSTQYKTYLEKRFMPDRHFTERAYRALTYLPVAVRSETNKETCGVIRDISESGMLLLSRIHLAQGDNISLKVVLGREVLSLKGTVTREDMSDSGNFQEFLVGVKLDDGHSDVVRRILEIADHIGGFVQA